MPPSAPIRVPVELRLAGTRSRWFRESQAISEQGLLFRRVLPDELEGPLALRFHLPDDTDSVELDGRVIELQPEPGTDAGRDEDDRPRKLGVAFIRPDEASRLRIARYVEARLLNP